MQNTRIAGALIVVLVLCTINVVSSGKAQSKKCQQYGHSCLGGHGKRSTDMAKPAYGTQLASDESEAQFDYDDVSANVGASTGTQNSAVSINYERLPIITTTGARYPLWFIQRFQKRQKTMSSEPFQNIITSQTSLNHEQQPAPLQQQQQPQQFQPQSQQQSQSQQTSSAHFNHRFSDIDQVYPVRVKGSVGQFSITDQIQFPL